MSSPKLFDLSLIKQVEINSILYDSSHPNYMDFNAREVAWQKIGDELRRPAAECKTRWVHIRDVYRRILKKALNNPGTKHRQYKYEKAMSFMRSVFKDMDAQNIDFENDEEEVQDDVHEEFNNDEGLAATNECSSGNDNEYEPLRTKTKNKRIKSTNKRKRKLSNHEQSDASHFENVISAELNPTDPLDAFLLSVRAIIKTFTPYRQNMVKTAIFTIVQDYERQSLELNEDDGDGQNERERSFTKIKTLDE